MYEQPATDKTQEMRAYFDWTEDRSFPHLPPPPSDDDIRMSLARNNANCPLNQIIVGRDNEKAFSLLTLMSFSVLKRFNRSARGNNFGIYCPPGQGKTFIVKRLAETWEIIFVFVQSPVLDSNYTLFEIIRSKAEEFGTPVVPHKTSRADFTLPPMLIFFDEAHKLGMNMMKGSLLNAMEPDDAIMVVRPPGRSGTTFSVDCHNVCWAAATTDKGDLFDAFASRLGTSIQWAPATEAELPLMIQQGLDRKVRDGELHLSPPLEACEIIARYQKTPRLAIHSFGVKVVQRKQFSPRESWQESCEEVARMIGLHECGLTLRQIAILKALGQRPIAEGRLGDVCGCRLKEVQRYELPGLAQYYNGGPYVVSVSGRGMAITRAGLRKLEEIGVAHGGDKVTAEHFEERR